MFDLPTVSAWATVATFGVLCLRIIHSLILYCRSQAFTAICAATPIDSNHHLGTEGAPSEAHQYVVELAVASSVGNPKVEFVVMILGGSFAELERTSNERCWICDHISGENARRLPDTYAMSPQSRRKTILVIDSADAQYRQLFAQTWKFPCGLSPRLLIAPVSFLSIPNLLLLKAIPFFKK